VSNKRLILLVAVAWIVVAGGVLLGFLMLSSDDAEPAARSELGSVAETAKEGYARVEGLAQEWQRDAALAAVTASWHDATLETLRGAPVWSFQFYSPTRQQVYVTTLVEGEAKGVRSTLVPYPLAAIPRDEWAVDTDRALEIWLDNGGAQLLAENPGRVELRLQLRVTDADEGGSRLLWTVTGFVFETNRFRSLRIDATSGQVIY
jgi:hypothetical protein